MIQTFESDFAMSAGTPVTIADKTIPQNLIAFVRDIRFSHMLITAGYIKLRIRDDNKDLTFHIGQTGINFPPVYNQDSGYWETPVELSGQVLITATCNGAQTVAGVSILYDLVPKIIREY